MLPARNLVPLAQLVQSEMTNTKTDEGLVVYTVPEVAAILIGPGDDGTVFPTSTPFTVA